jgi:hypothetical protein
MTGSRLLPGVPKSMMTLRFPALVTTSGVRPRRSPMSRTLLALVLLSAATPAFAQEEVDAETGRKIKYKERTEIEAHAERPEDDELDGSAPYWMEGYVPKPPEKDEQADLRIRYYYKDKE